MGTLLALTFHAAALSRNGVSVSFWPIIACYEGQQSTIADIRVMVLLTDILIQVSPSSLI
jgi:hypothetical protein